MPFLMSWLCAIFCNLHKPDQASEATNVTLGRGLLVNEHVPFLIIFMHENLPVKEFCNDVYLQVNVHQLLYPSSRLVSSSKNIQTYRSYATRVNVTV